MSVQISLFKSLLKKTFFAFLLVFSSSCSVFNNGVRITSYGHSALLIEGGGQSVLLNPFESVGCASGLSEPRVNVDVILASSQLADEGATNIAEGKFLVRPGSYQINQNIFEGFSAPHDRFKGRRYGMTTIWQWTQAGLRFAHLGGAVAPLSMEDKIILGRPDVLIIAVGGGSKVYNGLEAAQVIQELKPKHVIPVQYIRGEQPDNCDQTGIDSFLDAMNNIEVRNVGSNLYLDKDLPDKVVINLMN